MVLASQYSSKRIPLEHSIHPIENEAFSSGRVTVAFCSNEVTEVPRNGTVQDRIRMRVAYQLQIATMVTRLQVILIKVVTHCTNVDVQKTLKQDRKIVAQSIHTHARLHGIYRSRARETHQGCSCSYVCTWRLCRAARASRTKVSLESPSSRFFSPHSSQRENS